MLRHYLFPIVAVLTLTASTCERPADVEIEAPDPMLVVVSNFSDQRVLQVQVSKTISAFTGGGIEYVEDANVELFEEDEYIETLGLVAPQDQPPYYTTYELKPKVGVRYTIRVDVPGFKPVNAQSSIPPQIGIEQLQVTDIYQRDLDENNRLFYYKITLSFSDPGRARNFYHLKFFQQIKEYEKIQEEIFITNVHYKEITFSPLNDNNDQLAYFRGGVLFEDGILDGHSISYTFPLQTGIRTDREILGKVVAELRAVSEEYYLYHTSLSRQRDNPGVPFTEPVIVYDNIENGQGIFAGYSVTQDSLSIPQ